MSTYILNTEIYDKKIAPYLKEIILNKKIDKGKYDFAIEVGDKGKIGRIDCYLLSKLEGKIILCTKSCSEKINIKLEELIKPL